MKTRFYSRAISYDPLALLHLSFVSLLLIFLWASTPAWSTNYYVSTSGNDANSGLSLTSPLRTIQKGTEKAVAGDVVNVRAGVYREAVTVWKNAGQAGKMLTIQGYGSEVPVIKGSDVVTGWTQYNATIWKKTGWTVNSQQVFVDFNDASPTKPLQQIGLPSSLYTTYEYPKPVGSNLYSMVPGSFYYDANADTLYVWLADGSNPNNHYMEASTRARPFMMSVPYVYLKGFAFRHSNSSASVKQGAAVELSSNSVIDRCDIQYMDFTGLSMGYAQYNTQAINCNISNNGDSGIVASASYNFRVASVSMLGNNYRNFNQWWHAGGIKAASKAYGTVEFNVVGDNNSSGIWFDYCDGGQSLIVRNNYIWGNGPVEAGIFFEVSSNGLVYNNILINNARRGIYIASSDNNRVYNNTVYGTSVYAAIELGGMPRSGATLTGNSVNNNIVSHNTSKYDLLIAPANGTTIYGNTSNYNDFYRPTGYVQLAYGATLVSSLGSWSNTSQQDKNSLNVNPGYVKSVPAASQDFALLSSSPVINKAITLSAVPQDFAKTPRPSGAAYDIGAYEYGSTTTTASSSDTVFPTVSINTPSVDGSKVSGSLNIAGSSTDNVGISMMRLYVDGVLKSQAAKGTIYYPWDTSSLASGSTHYIMVSAVDAAGNMSQVNRKVIKY